MSLKLAKKLTQKKHRTETGLFIVEGKKNITELLLSDFIVESIAVTKEAEPYVEACIGAYVLRTKHAFPQVTLTTEENLAAHGSLESNDTGIAIARQKDNSSIETILAQAKRSLVLVLDDVRNPGNLGTIIRTADWFGVTHIVASPTTTDFYNPKTIAATMGSFSRISVTYHELTDFLKDAQEAHIHTYGAYLEGTSIYELAQSDISGVLVMGSESHGIDASLATYIETPLTIPRFGKAESLNVATATGIILAALRAHS